MDKEEKIKKDILKHGRVPEHVAVIMDGNGRWAKSKGMPRVFGHKKGVDTVKEIVKAAEDIGVKYLTLYTFSTENWKRPKDEVTTLMKLLVRSLKNEINELTDKGVKLQTIGETALLPKSVRDELIDSVERTKNNTGLVLTLALSYSGRWEMVQAIKKLSTAVKEGKLDPENIDEMLISQTLETSYMPDPDLMIRTGGEFRVSNFLLWQIAYSEFFITEVYWPEFTKSHFFEAINDYQKRERRFGKTSEQLS